MDGKRKRITKAKMKESLMALKQTGSSDPAQLPHMRLLTFYSTPTGLPLRWRVWYLLVFGFILAELTVVPYASVFAPAAAAPAALLAASTAVFLFDFVFLSWRLVPEGGPVPAGCREQLGRYARSWLLIDLIAVVPWSELSDGLTFDMLFVATRVLRAAKLRTSVPVILQLMGDDETHELIGWDTKVAGVIFSVFAVLVHLCACFLGSSVGYSTSHGLPSFISYHLGVSPEEVDPTSFETYFWSLIYCVYSFTSVGGLMAHNLGEGVVVILVLISCMVGFALCLATFSTLVQTEYRKAQCESDRQSSLKHYAHARGLPPRLARQIAEHLPDGCLLPGRALPHHLAAYEAAVLVAVPSALRQELKLAVFGELVRSAPFLHWMSTFDYAVQEAVDAATYEVVQPGRPLFENGQGVKDLCFLTGGAILIEEWIDENDDDGSSDDEEKSDEEDEDDQSPLPAGLNSLVLGTALSAKVGDGASGSPMNKRASRASFGGPLLHRQSSGARRSAERRGTLSKRKSDEKRQTLSRQFSQRRTGVFSSLDVDALPSAGFTRLSYVPMEPVSPLSGRCFATFPRDLGTVERKREVTWNDAVDATKQLFDSRQPGSKDDPAKPEELSVTAPAVFGEEALWYDTITPFTARSSGHAEVVLLPVATLRNLANKDGMIKLRYRLFRDYMLNLEANLEAGASRSSQ
jgi:hypothetical protein